MNIIFFANPIILASFHAGLREEGFMPAAILIPGPFWLLETGESCITAGNAESDNGSRNSLDESQGKPVLKWI